MSKAIATTLGIIACLIWSCSVLTGSILVKGFGPLRAVAWELTIGGLILMTSAAYRGFFKQLFQHPIKSYLLAGVFWVQNVIIFFVAVGLAKSDAELVVIGLINYLWPILTLVLSVLILGSSWNYGLVIGAVLSLTGVILSKLGTASSSELIESLNTNLPAYLCALYCATCWSFSSIFSRRYSDPNKVSPVCLYMLAAGILSWAFSYVDPVPQSTNVSDWMVLGCWTLCNAIACIAWDTGMRFGKISIISSCALFIPLLSTLITILGSGQEFKPEFILAAIFVVAGSTICSMSVFDKTRTGKKN